MSPMDLITAILLLAGAFFFLAGTLGVVRFPDTLTRLHALTKADNLGLGLVVLALLFRAETVLEGAKLLLIWALVLVASATSCYLVARAAGTSGTTGSPLEEERG